MKGLFLVSYHLHWQMKSHTVEHSYCIYNTHMYIRYVLRLVSRFLNPTVFAQNTVQLCDRHYLQSSVVVGEMYSSQLYRSQKGFGSSTTQRSSVMTVGRQVNRSSVYKMIWCIHLQSVFFCYGSLQRYCSCFSLSCTCVCRTYTQPISTMPVNNTPSRYQGNTLDYSRLHILWLLYICIQH